MPGGDTIVWTWLLVADCRAHKNACGKRALPIYAGCHRLLADIAAARSSDRGKRDRAAGMALTIQFVAMRSLAAGGARHPVIAEALVRFATARMMEALVCLIGLSRRWTRAAVGLPVHEPYGQKRGNGRLLTETAASWWRLGASGGGVAGLQGRQCRPRTCVSPAGLLASDHRTNCRDGDLLEC